MIFDKKRIIILISIILLVFLIVFIWGVFEMKNAAEKQGGSLEEGEIQGEKVLGLTGEVIKVDTKDNFLLVAPTKQDFYVKVFVSENVKISKTKLLVGTSTVPVAGSSGLGISDFKVGDRVSIRAKENIAGKSEISDIVSIQIMP